MDDQIMSESMNNEEIFELLKNHDDIQKLAEKMLIQMYKCSNSMIRFKDVLRHIVQNYEIDKKKLDEISENDIKNHYNSFKSFLETNKPPPCMNAVFNEMCKILYAKTYCGF